MADKMVAEIQIQASLSGGILRNGGEERERKKKKWGWVVGGGGCMNYLQYTC